MPMVFPASGSSNRSSAKRFVDGVKKSTVPDSVRMRMALSAGMETPMRALAPSG